MENRILPHIYNGGAVTRCRDAYFINGNDKITNAFFLPHPHLSEETLQPECVFIAKMNDGSFYITSANSIKHMFAVLIASGMSENQFNNWEISEIYPVLEHFGLTSDCFSIRIGA